MKKYTVPFILFFCLQLTMVFAQESKIIADNYKFRLGITYEIAAGNKDNLKKSQEMDLWYSDNGYTGFGIKANNAMFMVYDIKSMKMITLMEAQKMAMIIDVKRITQEHANDDKVAEAASAKVTKTGKKETILGYSCEQYRITTDQSESLVWVTTELGAGFGDFAKSMGAAIGGMKKTGISLPDVKELGNGIMLKMESTDTSSGEVAKIVATNINKNGKNISTNGYKMMNLPGQ